MPDSVRLVASEQRGNNPFLPIRFIDLLISLAESQENSRQRAKCQYLTVVPATQTSLEQKHLARLLEGAQTRLRRSTHG